MAQYNPDRIYLGVIENTLVTKSKKDQYQVRASVKITGMLKGQNKSDGIHAFLEEDQVVKTLYITLSETAVDRFFGDLRKLGFDSPDFELLDPGHPGHVSLKGNQVGLKVRYTKNDKGYESDFWSPYGLGSGPEVKPVDMKQLAEWKSTYKDLIQDGYEKASAGKPAVATTAAESGDDIPF